MLGWTEILVILVIVLLLFGGKRLPELAKSLGVGIREFKKASQEVVTEIENTKTSNLVQKNDKSNRENNTDG